MSRLSKLVRKYVKCPQLDGGTRYGEWGTLRLNQRKQIAKLCEEVNVFEDAADKFGKENFILTQRLAEKDKEIESLRKEFSSRLRLLRHPICEEIRRFIRQPENSIFYDVSLYVETAGLEKLLDKLEKGE